jgi:tetratricopeptide (TPR) repeat protein
MHIAMSNTRDGNDAAAEAATNKLIANYSGYKPIARAVCQIADQYYQSQRHQNADKLYQKIVEKWPDTGDAMWAQMHIAMSNIRDGNVAAEAATDKLLTNYAGQENITEAACQIADQYSQSQKYQQADKLYQEIIERCGAKHAILAKAGMVKLNILLGNEAAAEAAINKLITDFSGHPDLPRTLLIIGEEYYKKGLSKESEGPADQARDHFEKAVKMWGRLINEFPNSALIPETCCWAGDCYHKLGQYEKSIQCFQKVVDNYPGYEYAWHAQFMVGRCYEGLKDTGAIEKSVADAQINTAYEQLLKKYPDCPVAEYARVWMSRYGSK